jgi:Zn-dependent M16 (insulinase) family peptidase
MGLELDLNQQSNLLDSKQGPIWKHVRDAGLVYGLSMNLKPNELMIYLVPKF